MSLVLLGCRVAGPAALSPPAERRAERALSAFEAGLASELLVCGGKAWDGVREADALGSYLIERGVPERAVTRELHSHSTRANAHYAAELLLPRGLWRIGVVTCDWHMPRALRCFRSVGFEAHAVPAVSPPVPLFDAVLRSGRERVAFALDGLSWGLSRL